MDLFRYLKPCDVIFNGIRAHIDAVVIDWLWYSQEMPAFNWGLGATSLELKLYAIRHTVTSLLMFDMWHKAYLDGDVFIGIKAGFVNLPYIVGMFLAIRRVVGA